MKLPSFSHRAQLVSAGVGAVVAVFSTLLTVSAQAQSTIPRLSQAAQQTAAEKVRAFGLTPEPQPFIPQELSQSSNPTEGGRGVIGIRDDRVPMTSRSYPWSAIGRLESPLGGQYVSICTATLVAPDVVLTNAHCVVDPETHQVRQAITFKPNLVYGQVNSATDVAMVIDVVFGTNFRDSAAAPHPNDWAFAKLDRPLGNKYGTLAWTPLSVSQLVRNYRDRLTMAGYSGDFPAYGPGRTAGVHRGCNVLGEVEGSLIHDCDSYGGSSGGPILATINGQVRIVGLNSAELYEEGHSPGTNETTRVGIINYGVQMNRVVTFLRQSLGIAES